MVDIEMASWCRETVAIPVRSPDQSREDFLITDWVNYSGPCLVSKMKDQSM